MRWRHKYCCLARLFTALLFVGSIILWGQKWQNKMTVETVLDEIQMQKLYSNSKSVVKPNTLNVPKPHLTPSAFGDQPKNLDIRSLGKDSSDSNSLGFNSTTSEFSSRITDPYRYILNEPSVCLKQTPFLVLVIAVEGKQKDARNAIRQTWGNLSTAGGVSLVRLFFLGTNRDFDGNDSKLQHTLEEESLQHHDIIQQDYTDSYQNLTLKTLMAMYWITKFCPTASYVMKTDSDMFVNTEYLINSLLKQEGIPRHGYFTGSLMKNYTPNRHKDSKWYMPFELFPDSMYPTFCSGTGYVFSADMAQRIYEVSGSVPRLPLEDVYVGVCLAKLRIEPVPPLNRFMFNHWRVTYSSCKYSYLITSHSFHPNELITYWRHLQSNKNNPCGFARFKVIKNFRSRG